MSVDFERAPHLVRQNLGRPCGRPPGRRRLPALYRPPPRPRGDEPAGVRGLAPDRAQGARAGRRRSPSSTTTCRRPIARCRHRRSRRAAPQIEQLAEQRARIRHRILRRARSPPGHRPHHRAGAGLHLARHDDRLRRQPHLDARRLRRARARHRHLRSRACAGDADADPDRRPRTCACASTARCADGVTAKDIILAIIGEIGTAGGTGHVIEYAGEAIRALSMEGRMTVCNMSIEGGARAGMVAPDEKTFAYLKDRPKAPKGEHVGCGAALLGRAAHRRRRAFRPRGHARRRRSAADRHLGHQPRGCRRRSPASCPTPSDGKTDAQARRRSSARSTTWA